MSAAKAARRLGGLAALLFTLALAQTAPAGNLAVRSLLPTGQVQRLTQVVARFSKPMRPLGEMGVAVQDAPLRLSPRPAGSFRWLDPSTLAFLLDRPQVGATRIKVLIPAGTRALDGSLLGFDVRTVITTPPVEALKTMPAPGSPLGPRPELRVVMNQPVDLASLAAHSRVRAGDASIPVSAKAVPPPSWQPPGQNLARVYVLTPQRNLPAGRKASLVVGPGVRPASGNLAMARAKRFAYAGFSRLKLTGWEMGKAVGGGQDPTAPLVLRFNNPVSARQVARLARFSPPLKLDPEQLSDQPSAWVVLPAGFKPRTAYRLSLPAGLTDAYGTSLAGPAGISFSTGDLEPILNLAGGKGVLEAGGPPLYPLLVRNLDKVRVAVRFIPPAGAIKALLAEEERPWDKTPAPPRDGVDGARVKLIGPGLPRNKTGRKPLDLDALLGRSPMGGLVLVDVRGRWPDQKGKPKDHWRRALVQVTDLGLSLKLGESASAAWVTSLASGQPLAGVELSLFDRTGKKLWQGQSDQRGLALLPPLDKLKPAPNKQRPWLNPQVLLTASKDGDWAVLPGQWSQDLMFSIPPDVPQARPGEIPALLAHAITQLPLYQPGQTVRLCLYLRRPGPTGLVPPPPGEVTIQVSDPQGGKAATLKGRSDRFGSVAGQFTLSAAARLGGYAISATVGGKEVHAGSFRVASFRPPDFALKLDAPTELVGPVPARASLEARYLFGLPVAAGAAKLRAQQQPDWYTPPALEGWAVGDIPLPGSEPRGSKDLGEAKATLDAQGRAVLALPAATPLPGLPVRVGLDASVKDASGRAVHAGASYRVHPAAIYLGIKAPVLAQAGRPAEVLVRTAPAQGKGPAPARVRLAAYRQVWETVRERGPGGFWHHLGRARRSEVWSRELAAGAEPAKASFTPPKPGTYVLVAEAKDTVGRLTRSAAYLFAAGAGAAGWERFDDHRLELVGPDGELRPGDKASVLIKSPFARATALVSVERAGVRRLYLRQVKGPAPVVEVPVQAGDAPNVFVGVLLVRGRVAGPGPNGLDLGKPQVRIGYAEIKVGDPDSGLKVSITPDKEQVRPGAEVSALVKVSRRDGTPAQAQVTVLAVDERVLSVAGRDNYDPHRTFGAHRPLAVLTADGRTQVVGQRFYGKKGESANGGGGAGPGLRQKFHPAVFWLAQGRLDQDGSLRVRFTLPDSLTAYRLVAVAADQGGAFGLGRARVTARSPLQILSALPRFVVAGDEFSARVLVQNLTESPATAVVTAAAQGLALTGAGRQRVELAPGQSRALGFAVKAGPPGRAALTVRAEMAGHSDAARFTLPVLTPMGLSHAQAAGVLTPGAAPARVPLLIPAGSDPERGGLTVTVSPDLSASLKPAAAAIADYPYECLEQRLSKAALLALRLSRGPQLGLPPAPDDRDRLTRTLAQLGDYQMPGGGMVMWPGLERPTPFVTAYALVALERIARAGGQAPPGLEKSALEWVARWAKRSKAPAAGDTAGRLAEALAIRALAGRGRKVRGLIESALLRSAGLPPFGLGCLLEAAELSGQAKAADALLALLMASAEQTAAETHFAAVDPGGLKAVMGSTLRGNGQALIALCRLSPRPDRLFALATWLARSAGGRPWLSTQEAVYALWGLGDYLALTKAPAGQEPEVKVSLDGGLLAEHRFAPGGPPLTVQPPRRRLRAGVEQVLALSAAGGGSPMYQAQLAYAPARPAARPLSAGFTVTRSYHYEGSAQGKPPALGQEVECRLTVVVPQSRHYVLVRDPYPAGLEPDRAAANDPRSRQGPRGAAWEWGELRMDSAILYARRLRPGVYGFRYRLRAVAPGHFLLRPLKAEEMYSPEVMGRSAAGELTVR